MPDLRDVQQAPGPVRLTAAKAGPPGSPVRVACDPYGPTARVAAEGMRLALEADPALTIVAAGNDVQAAFGSPGAPGRLETLPGRPLVIGEGDPARAVRSQRDASVRVAARLVRDRQCDACVLLGRVDIAIAGARFALRLLPGATGPVVAADVGGVVVVDVSGRTELDRAAAAAASAQSALLGVAFARSRWGVDRPEVAALAAAGISPDAESARPVAEALRRYADAGLIRLRPAVQVAELFDADRDVDVVVTDGFSGNVLREALAAAGPSWSAGPRRAAVNIPPTPRGGGMVLGLEGVVVVGTADSPQAYAQAVALAAHAHRSGLVAATAAALGDLVAWRRLAAGLNPVTP